ncbi:MAG: DUF5005 domain-containing protein [Desulfobacterales bacterium]
MSPIDHPRRFADRHNIRRLVYAAVLLACLLGLCWTPWGCARPLAPADERTYPADVHLPPAAPDSFHNELFTRRDGGWTGGDGTRSVSLPDGRILWLFGDTFLGRVRPDHSRADSAPMVRNTFVLQSGDTLVTLHGGTKADPRALVSPPAKGSWYWPSDGLVEGGRLRVFLPRFTVTGPGMWDWHWSGTDIATFSLPKFHLEKITAVRSTNGVTYGAALLRDAGVTYVYGVEDLQSANHVHVARAVSGHLCGVWEYWNGARWDPDPRESKRLLAGAALQFSVLKTGDHYVLITSDNRQPFDSDIVAYAAPSPTGPWSESIRLYRPPEATGDLVAYNALAHPDLSPPGRLLVSYNLNNVRDPAAVYRNADIYRPRFILIDLEGLLKQYLMLSK